MAAHALTIVRQITDVIRHHGTEQGIRYACMALDAPGLDGFTYPGLRLELPEDQLMTGLYGELYSACLDGVMLNETRAREIQRACALIEERCRHLVHYRSLGAAHSAWLRFVRPGVPWARKRRQEWNRFPWTQENHPTPADCYL